MTNLKARLLINFALLTIAGILIIYFWLDPLRQTPPPSDKLSGIDPTLVERVRIERPKREAIELRREASGWRLIRPAELPANDNRVAALLGLAAARVHEAFRAEGNDLAEFGLQPPLARILFDDHELRFGDTDALNGWRYVQYGPDVHLITDAYFHHVLATAAGFVDPAPIGTGSQPTAIALERTRLRLEKGRWRSASPGLDFGEQAANRLVEAWKSARAASVKTFDPALDWGQTLEIELAGETEPISFKIARLEHEVVIGRPRWRVQYHFPEKAGKRLLELDERKPSPASY